jgi:hypothetical protein
MTDEYDEFNDNDEQPLDEEPVEETTPDTPAEEALDDARPALAGPEDWPEAARMEVARLRRENKRHRIRRREIREAQLQQTYGAEAVAMIPVEVTDPARREELAATYAERIGHVAPQVPPGLAAVAQAPASGTAEPVGDSISLEEFNAHVAEIGLTQASLQYGHRVNMENNPLRDRLARPVQGQYRAPS